MVSIWRPNEKTFEVLWIDTLPIVWVYFENVDLNNAAPVSVILYLKKNLLISKSLFLEKSEIISKQGKGINKYLNLILRTHCKYRGVSFQVVFCILFVYMCIYFHKIGSNCEFNLVTLTKKA